MFKRPEHQAVATALQAMDHDWLAQCRCWFGGGTEIVLDLGEYRLSKDIDFLCADADGYRALRSAAVSQGITAFFARDAVLERLFRSALGMDLPTLTAAVTALGREADRNR